MHRQEARYAPKKSVSRQGVTPRPSMAMATAIAASAARRSTAKPTKYGRFQWRCSRRVPTSSCGARMPALLMTVTSAARVTERVRASTSPTRISSGCMQSNPAVPKAPLATARR